jgi:UDP-glucuronate decarboxylase
MKILITGERGFLGSNLKKAFKSNLFATHFAIKEDFEIISLPCDVKEIDLMNTKIKVDRIYHLAGVPSPTKYKKNPVDVLLSSVWGTFNVLELAKKTGARVLFTSTVNTDKYYPANDPRAVYVDGKKAAEDLCYLYRNEVDARVVKLFSTYGVGMQINDGRVIPDFIQKALAGEPLSIYGDGSQIDSFCYVSDMIDAFYLLMEADNPGKPVELGNPFIVGRSGLTSIRELAETIIGICHSDSPIRYIPYSGFDKERIPNIVYAMKELNWQPRVGLIEGLEKTAYYFKEVLKCDA